MLRRCKGSRRPRRASTWTARALSFVVLVSLQGQLQGVPVLELPTDRPYPPGGLSSAGDSSNVIVPPETAAALRRLTSACSTTLYTTLLTSWKVGACRLGGRSLSLGWAELYHACTTVSTCPASDAQRGMLPHACSVQWLIMAAGCAGHAEPLLQADGHHRRLANVRAPRCSNGLSSGRCAEHKPAYVGKCDVTALLAYGEA